MQNFLNKIICGDCIEVLGRAREPFADLIFADPPFNIGYKYDRYYDKVKKNFTFNDLAVRVPSDRQLIYSEKYVEHSNERLAELKKQRCGNPYFNAAEMEEVKRLSRDTRRTPRDISADSTLLKYFANQFAVGTNGEKRYSAEKIATALEDLAG
ncbi:MAG: hypothetical protein H8E73_04175 [Planctomycetes bacterium]|nr:hypothetical protein [Planctomycetota bacterium]MBL7185185.1 hypothetical protein [Phycisphaerae bacterium]